MKRDDMQPQSRTWQFDALDPKLQRTLERAATYGRCDSCVEHLAPVGADWIMVPSKRGLVQVVCKDGVAYRL